MQNSGDGARSEDVTRYLGASSIFLSPILHLKISCEKVEKIRGGGGVRMPTLAFEGGIWDAGKW